MGNVLQIYSSVLQRGAQLSRNELKCKLPKKGIIRAFPFRWCLVQAALGGMFLSVQEQLNDELGWGGIELQVHAERVPGEIVTRREQNTDTVLPPSAPHRFCRY